MAAGKETFNEWALRLLKAAATRDKLVEQLRRMTVENGCTPAEAEVAHRMAKRLTEGIGRYRGKEGA